MRLRVQLCLDGMVEVFGELMFGLLSQCSRGDVCGGGMV